LTDDKNSSISSKFDKLNLHGKLDFGPANNNEQASTWAMLPAIQKIKLWFGLKQIW